MTPDMLKNPQFLKGETSAGHLNFFDPTGTSGPNWFLGKKWMVSLRSSKVVWPFLVEEKAVMWDCFCWVGQKTHISCVYI